MGSGCNNCTNYKRPANKKPLNWNDNVLTQRFFKSKVRVFHNSFLPQIKDHNIKKNSIITIERKPILALPINSKNECKDPSLVGSYKSSFNNTTGFSQIVQPNKGELVIQTPSQKKSKFLPQNITVFQKHRISNVKNILKNKEMPNSLLCKEYNMESITFVDLKMVIYDKTMHYKMY